MSDEFLKDREKSFEALFFSKQSAELIARLRSEKKKKAAKEGLRDVSGIGDDEVLDKLVELDIEPDTWAAVSLVPLVEVAWADGKIDDRERQAVLSGARANGIEPGSPSYELLETWLRHRPDGRLLEGWGEYIVELCAKLAVKEKAALKREVLGRARKVAEAAGGILGFGKRVSAEEEVVLDHLEKAFG